MELFSTYIVHRRLQSVAKSRVLNSQLIREIEVLRREDRAGHEWCQQNYGPGYTSYGSIDQLHLNSPTFAELAELILKQVFRFAKSLGWYKAGTRKSPFKMVTLWVNYMEKGSYHNFHIHPKSVISGTYYVLTDPTSSPIRFADPRLGFFMNRPLPLAKAPIKVQNYRSISPQAGDLVLFESWLNHEVPKQIGTKPRMSISFNCDI